MSRLSITLALLLLTGCPAGSGRPAATRSPVGSISEINLAEIGPLAPKGRVQDAEYNRSRVVEELLAHGKESIPYLISKLDDETKIGTHVLDYWSEVSPHVYSDWPDFEARTLRGQIVKLHLFTARSERCLFVAAFALALAGWVSARLAISPRLPAVVRNVAGGLLAMGVTYLIGSLVGAQI